MCHRIIQRDRKCRKVINFDCELGLPAKQLLLRVNGKVKNTKDMGCNYISMSVIESLSSLITRAYSKNNL